MDESIIFYHLWTQVDNRETMKKEKKNNIDQNENICSLWQRNCRIRGLFFVVSGQIITYGQSGNI